jgi:hypothetical protein
MPLKVPQRCPGEQCSDCGSNVPALLPFTGQLAIDLLPHRTQVPDSTEPGCQRNRCVPRALLHPAVDADTGFARHRGSGSAYSTAPGARAPYRRRVPYTSEMPYTVSRDRRQGTSLSESNAMTFAIGCAIALTTGGLIWVTARLVRRVVALWRVTASIQRRPPPTQDDGTNGVVDTKPADEPAATTGPSQSSAPAE